ncbi:PH domain-containing protein [Streptomyces tsukubensis]|uniref:Low molecular weight protein antigen 6 PH domain-containing protein n=1 Tax=Streptomyces tsukubensis TaxID=83656 RepID=A0A1V4AF74_9ACTN|nr:PH domain-containing protein [Streptomyces tsukubensis]OON82039.1 hypothetical protein B1H18_02945 [Streptomyces tsukubensis]QFR92523.1 PH domain-containing protein [Streptomyces tsukubensis]
MPQDPKDQRGVPAEHGTPDVPALPRTFRPSLTRAVLICAGIAMLAVLTAVGLMLEGFTGGERLSFVLTGVLLFGVMLLLSRPKIVVAESGVTVVNLTNKRRLAWAEILQVNLRPGDPWVFLNLSDGTRLPALGIQPGIAKQRAISDARALRALVDTRSYAPEEAQG